jgi:L-lactate utilization protein LutB
MRYKMINNPLHSLYTYDYFFFLQRDTTADIRDYIFFSHPKEKKRKKRKEKNKKFYLSIVDDKLVTALRFCFFVLAKIFVCISCGHVIFTTHIYALIQLTNAKSFSRK